MASYFDISPSRSKASAAPTAELQVPESSGLGKMSLLSPQVSAILDDLELDDKSSSEEDKASLSGDSNPSDKDAKSDSKSRPGKPKREQSAKKVQASPLAQPSNKKVHKAPAARPSVGGKHPHLARFHSLRSMLFQSNIEANMVKANETGANDTPECQWKAEHEQRQGLNRPKTPESAPKQGFAHKLGNSLRRLTSKDVPTMNSIREVGDDNESTASDDDEDERRRVAEDSEEIDHSDIEDIVRWVSRRDPPSDGEKSRGPTVSKEAGKEDSGHESFGNSDVDDLVRWVSRKETHQTKTPAIVESKPKDAVVDPKHEEAIITGESDASTQSDSEAESIDEDDMDDLVRWVSRREGPNAGPIRDSKTASPRDLSKLNTRTEDVVEEDDEVERWKSREHDMSGESDVPDDLASEEPGLAKTRVGGSGLKIEVGGREGRESNAGLKEEDVDELVRWVSSRNVTRE